MRGEGQVALQEAGAKVVNLILTVLVRGQNGELIQFATKLNNFSTDFKSAGTDAFFTADVMEFHLTSKRDGGSGFFDDICHITQSGDHGPHFSCVETMFIVGVGAASTHQIISNRI